MADDFIQERQAAVVVKDKYAMTHAPAFYMTCQKKILP